MFSGKRLHHFQANYSGNSAPNFIRIAGILWEILQKTFWSLFPGHSVLFTDRKWHMQHCTAVSAIAELLL